MLFDSPLLIAWVSFGRMQTDLNVTQRKYAEKTGHQPNDCATRMCSIQDKWAQSDRLLPTVHELVYNMIPTCEGTDVCENCQHMTRRFIFSLQVENTHRKEFTILAGDGMCECIIIFHSQGLYVAESYSKPWWDFTLLRLIIELSSGHMSSSHS